MFIIHVLNSYYEQIVEEAGGIVSCMDGKKYSVFDRTCLASNGVLHAKVRLLFLYLDKLM